MLVVYVALFGLQLRAPPPRLVRAPAARCCAAASPSEALFAELLQSPGVRSSVRLRAAPDGSHTLVATREVAAGAAVLAVPKALLVTAHRSGVVDGLQGQTDATWDAAGDLREEVGEAMYERGATWDVRLALGVFEACAGAGGPFWDRYRTLLPTPPYMTHPLTLPPALLAELQDDELEARARARASLLEGLYPDLHDHEVHPATAAYLARGAPPDAIPRPLPYSYALTVSRCFTLSDGETFAFTPFLDMCEHEASPAANFASDERGFVLKALRNISADDEVTICYGEDYSSARLMEQYGFAPYGEGTAQDASMLRRVVGAGFAAGDLGVAEAIASAPATALGDSNAGIQALGAAFDACAASRLSSAERRGAIFDALTEADAGGGLPPVGPGPLLAAVRWQLDALPTTLQDDEEAMDECLLAGAGADPRPRAVLGYRLARKRQLALTEEILSAMLGV